MKKRDNRRRVRRSKKTVLLPQELIIEILLRLLVKSLIRFKCVCKSWLSLISDPHFAISHFELAAAHTERLVFLKFSVPECRSIDFNASFHDDSASAALNLNFLPPKPYYVQILGSCRGILLLECSECLWVWNPSTGVHKQVCCSPIASNMDVMLFTFLYGFGYDPSTDDYLVVHGVYNPNDDRITRVEYFSLRANAWKEIEGIHLPYMNCCDDIGVGSLLNGAIHWYGFRYDVSVNVIVAFDLIERSFSEIPLPADLVCYFDLNIYHLGVLGEFLSICVLGSCPTEIWVMEEYKVQSSWTKTIDVSLDDIPTKYFSLICSTKSGDIVGTTDGTSAVLAKCNVEGQLQELRTYCNHSEGHQVAVYTESLLSLTCDSEQAEEDD